MFSMGFLQFQLAKFLCSTWGSQVKSRRPGRLQLNEQPKFMEISRIIGGLKQSAIMLCKVFLAAAGIFEKGDVICSTIRSRSELTREHVGFNLLREKVKELQDASPAVE